MLFFGQINRLLNRHPFRNRIYFDELKERLSRTNHKDLSLLEKLLVEEIKYLNNLLPYQEPIVLKYGKRDDF